MKLPEDAVTPHAHTTNREASTKETAHGRPASFEDDVPLVLGGHSFIGQLGNEPRPSEDTQCAIVEACLDNGIRWFDTTHRPERVALGKALHRLQRRDEAVIIAWNFFDDVGIKPEDGLDRAAPYQRHHIAEMLEQLQTSFIDCLVVHPVAGGDEVNAAQLELALEWQKSGYVGVLGTWEPGEDAVERFGPENPYDFMVRPLNMATPDAGPAFAAAKRLGWRTLAASPFVRGWHLDRLVAAARKSWRGSESDLRGRLADHMLRYSLFHPNVDRVITAMRRVEWVAANVESVHRGPLTASERQWLDSISS
ncbi:MAG TPA: aldo/keto reductase [Candidatus Latescibacteria bacterium]|nr:aldo/keto reductase [Candidatus Latescibacterota bacterium]HOF61508.1 aldo/keto reductase [Candidatus Latescibacterota bacterium]HOS63908.1 aldo/keto reductase [Candidatus Latescibacterota bacterium]HPK73803.1 aldo/keto reductase [Candidatus Latescibacterota bacterium]